MPFYTHTERHRQLDEFLDRPSTHVLDDISLGRFLLYDEERARPSSAVLLDELEERLELVKQVQYRLFGKLRRNASEAKRAERQFTAFQLSAMMMMPLDNLRKLESTLDIFKDIESLIKICMCLPIAYISLLANNPMNSPPAWTPWPTGH
jgi:hypothetical protein